MNVVKNDRKTYVDVYFTKIDSGISAAPVFPKERDDEINAVSNERVRLEKYTAWRLLEYALSKSLGMSLLDAELYKEESGKWRSPHLELSISHSGSLAAVVISHSPVGIDVEPLTKSLSDNFAKKNLTENELVEYDALRESHKKEYLLTRWCIKEAVFKKTGGIIFFPSKIDSTKEKFVTNRFTLGTDEYACAVAGSFDEVSPVFRLVEKL